MTPIIAKLAGVGMLALIALSGCVVVEEGGPPYRPPPPGPGPTVCPQIYAPVCGVRRGDRETFPNQCTAEARGFRVIADGECRRERPPISRPPGPRPPYGGPPPRPGRPQVCTREFAPVCAIRGGERRSFGNACSAVSEGFRVVGQGGC
ncbi:Kazal-type serine protease inhibitor domain-containing protein [Pararhizobium haloflavum]|uniref:Kazal-type serine protease inhibitor domain-containing protein n=1 Tax=Pararhizobium haloflavum TaxID=2037914 RepID=UPI0027BA1AA1|nr:Kazal-type serine protease inhibitor domain-containing protein [Pararhizobium haloflavum]